MKKNILLYALLGLMAVVTSCSKTDETEKAPISTADMAIWNKVQDFKARMANPLKDGDPLAVDSAVWYIETTLNCTYGDASYEFTDMHTDSAFTTLPVENGQVDMAAVTVAYNQLLDSIRQHYYGLAATDKQFVFANVELIPTGLKTSEVTLKVTSDVGEASTVSPLNFGSGDNWIWGWDQGKCDGTSVGQDATDKFEQKINLRIAAPANSYFINPTTIPYVNAHDFSNPNFNPPTDPHPFMMYTGSGFSDCIEWEDMNFYLAGQVHILFTQLRPAGKLLISYDIHEEILGSDYHLHAISDIKYGQPVSRPPGGGEDL